MLAQFFLLGPTSRAYIWPIHPIVFIINDWRSQLMAGIGALLLLIAVMMP
ncbi:hypothetical protein [Bradyrhizobium icense]|nr:hypothetical protein [Bradyrhizobium icense]